jgi:hypothetical protein
MDCALSAVARMERSGSVLDNNKHESLPLLAENGGDYNRWE